MMRSALSSLLILLCIAGVHAQQDLDSLRAVWNDASRPDTVRLKALNKLANDGYLYTQPDSAEILARQQYAFAEATGQKKFMGTALNLAGISLAMRGDLPGALDHFSRSAELFDSLHERLLHANALNNIGLARSEMGQKTLALDALMQSLKAAEQLNDSSLIARTLGNIGIIYYDVGDNEHALDHYNRRLAIATRIKEWMIVAEVLNNIAAIRMEAGDTTEAKSLFERTIAICDSIGYGRQSIISLCNLGDIHFGQKDLPQAQACFERGYALAEGLGDEDNMATALLGIGKVQLDHGERVNARASFTRALSIAQRVGATRTLQNVSWALYDLYKREGRAPDALRMHELYLDMKDSTTSEEAKRGVMGQRFQYEYEKKEALLQSEQEKKDAVAAAELRRKRLQRNAFIGGFGLMLLLAGVFFTQRNRISKEKKRSEELLLNILPEEVAEELKVKGHADARHFDNATILFTDFKGFTQLSEKVTPAELVAELNACFKAFDGIMGTYRIEKIKTIGDAYMAAGGLPDPQHGSPADVILAALEMQDFMQRHKVEREAAGRPYFEMRVGIHSGPVVAGIVGVKKFQYDIWGDTVNTASRMESSGEVGKVNISEATYRLVNGEGRMANGAGGNSHSPTPSHHSPAFTFTPRGKVQAKGKGEMEMYFVSRSGSGKAG